MRAILVDPWRRRVKAIQTPAGLRDMYRLIGCSGIDGFRFPANKTEWVFVDDEGLLREPRPAMFVLKDYSQPLVGRGLILGATPNGDSMSSRLMVEEIERVISWEFWEIRFDSLADIRRAMRPARI